MAVVSLLYYSQRTAAAAAAGNFHPKAEQKEAQPPKTLKLDYFFVSSTDDVTL